MDLGGHNLTHDREDSGKCSSPPEMGAVVPKDRTDAHRAEGDASPSIPLFTKRSLSTYDMPGSVWCWRLKGDLGLSLVLVLGMSRQVHQEIVT